ncbi:unnamed protein product [Dibothriocephalus latus]|uniref:Uncharacterized protein n=1 Tax=Dibothriocephalus latus TaxID=60516 RepID=A0A3P7QYU5_DIBLA|nr:unnamed protein product [Dibothriocephalus latus]
MGTGRLPIRNVHQIDVFRPQNMMEAYRAAVGVSELSRILVEMATMSEGMFSGFFFSFSLPHRFCTILAPQLCLLYLLSEVFCNC